MARLFRLMFLMLGLVLVFGVSFQETRAVDPNAPTVADRLEQFFEFADTLSEFEELGDAIPLTAIDPSAEDALRLASLLADADSDPSNSLEDKLQHEIAGADDIALAIEGAGGDYGGVTVAFRDVSVQQSGDIVDIDFTLTLTRDDVALPISFSSDPVTLNGGGVEVDFLLSAPLSFRLDTSIADPDLDFYLDTEPTIDVSMNATGAITGLNAQVGFIDMSVTGTANLDLRVAIVFDDPDDDGQITVDEFTNTALADLVDMSFSGESVNVTLELNSELIPGGPPDVGPDDATITVVDNDLTNGFDPVITPSLGALDDFDNITPSQIIGGLTQLAASLTSAQGIAGGRLPFIQGSLDSIGGQKIFEIAGPLLDFVDGQTAAVIVCGTNNNDPDMPSGSAANLPAGSTLYCQATTVEDPVGGSVLWDIPGATPGANTSGSDADNTVGTDPSVSAVFTNVSGTPDVQVTFTDSSGTRTVDPIQTAQELFEQLVALGFESSSSPDNLVYDPATKALTYRLKKTLVLVDPSEKTGQIDFGDQLREATNLAGLSAAAGAKATVDVDDVDLDLTFGVILVEDPADITPGVGDGTTADRFFVKVNNEVGQHEFKVGDAAIDADVYLNGRVGFLEVSAEADPALGDDAFAVGKVTGAESDPVLAVDIKTPPGGIPIQGLSIIPDAILIPDLLGDLGPNTIDAKCNLKMSGGIKVSATVGGRELASGTVGINWPDVFGDDCIPDTDNLAVTADTNFDANLKLFDTVPTVTGTHDGADGAASLTDTTKNFNDLGNLLNATLTNKTTGASCVITSISGTTTLNCALSGGSRQTWNNGDQYEVAGNPLSMLSTILDNLDELVEMLEDVVDVDQEIPLLGISTKDLVAKIQNLKVTLDDLRGFPTATITCGLNDADPPTNPEGQDITSVLDGTPIYCQAETTEDVESFSWKITKGGTIASGYSATQADTVGPSPTANIKFTIDDGDAGDPTTTDPTTTISEYQIILEYTDPSGTHTADLPPLAPPTSLQRLEEAIEQKLGIAADALKLELLDIGPEKATGTHDGGDDQGTLTDSGASFVTGSGVLPGNTVTNVTKGESCRITSVTATTAACALSGGADWDNGDEYTIYGDQTADLVIRLGYGFCTDTNGDVSNNENVTHVRCQAGDRAVDKPIAPLNIDLDAFGGLVRLDTTSTTFLLEFAARGQLDISIALKLDVPEIKVLDTTKIELDAGVAADNVNLTASIAGLELDLGTSVEIASGDHDAGASTDTLTDNDTTFTTTSPPHLGETLVSVGTTVKNTPKNESCVITAVGAHTLTCDGGLSGGAEWESGDAYEVIGAGVAMLGAKLKVANPGADSGKEDNDGFSLGDFISGLGASFSGVDQDCGGEIDPYPAGGGDTQDLEGHACARLSIGSDLFPAGGYVGDITFLAPDFGYPSGWVFGSPDLQSLIDHFELDWILIIQALPKLLENLETTLNGSASDVRVPLIGDALDAGADIVKKIKENVADPLAALATALEEGGDYDEDGDVDALDLEALAQDTIFDIIGPGGSAGITLLRDTNEDGSIPVTKDDVIITALCDHSGTLGACVDGDGPYSIGDFRITLLIGQGVVSDDPGCDATSGDCVEGKELPIDLGLPGFPLRLAGTIKADASWELLVDFGLSREHGPYLVTDGPGHGSDPELAVGASLELGEATGDECDRDPLPGDPNDEPAELGGFSTNRCVLGELGFLTLTIRDGDTPSDPLKEPTKVSLRAQVDLQSDGADPDRLTFPELLGGKADLEFKLVADANVDVRFRTGLNLPTEYAPDFPSVLGRFHLVWAWDILDDPSVPSPTLLEFDSLYLDAGRFISDTLGPTAQEIERILRPFKPFIDFVQAPLPVISDISEMAGGPPISLITIIEAASGQDLSMVRSVLEVMQFISNLPAAESGLLIPLSSNPLNGFSVNADQAKEGPLTPDRAGDIISNVTNPQANLLTQPAWNGSTPAIGGNPETTPDGRPKTFGVSGLSFPFLNGAGEIFKVLMGQDVTLVRYEAGPLRASAGFEYCAPPFIVVVVPVEVCFGGSIELKGRFAMGYDTRGLRQLIGEGGSAGDLLDGIFLDDLDANGSDVPEFTVIGTVYVSGAATVFIISVGVKAGLEATVDFNLDDRPDPDGKLYIEEIVDKLSNPICLFVISGKLDVFLAAFVEIDLFLFSKEFTIDIIRITLLEFSHACDPPAPNPADVVGNDIYINIGPRKLLRNINTDDNDEEVIIRQLRPAACGEATRISIAMFGAYEEHDLPTGGRIIADGGVGDDQILLLPGATQFDDPIPFNAPAVINGGPGNDEIKTGGCGDTITGDEGAESGDDGNDKIDAGDGNDNINGNGGSDQILAGKGNDNPVRGGAGEDTINGGEGNDYIYGDGGNDVLNGGPAPEGADDGSDRIYGGAGEDSLTGGTGGDFLYGDESLGCDAEGSGGGSSDPRRDSLDGGDGIDHLYGGADDDYLLGGKGNDILCGNGGDDILDGDDEDPSTPDGDDELHGGQDNDTLYGRAGHDQLFGDAGSGNDVLFGGPGPDDLIGGDGRDILRGEGGNDILLGDTGSIASHSAADHDRPMQEVVALVTPTNAAAKGSVSVAQCENNQVVPQLTDPGNADCLFGGDGKDFLFGEGGHDKMFGDDREDPKSSEHYEDYMEGNAGNDLMRGGHHDDEMHGNAGSDDMHGDSGEDVMFGEENDDTMRGGKGDDRMVGGSSTAETPDDGDDMKGDAGEDWMAGDNAQLVPVGSELRIKLLDLYLTGETIDPSYSGDDIMYGNAAKDVMYGQGDNDTMHGNAADDYMEGNSGSDTMYGDAGEDDMVGGSGHDNGGPGGDVRELSEVIDDNVGGPGTGDTMHGGDGVDFMAGDNANITRTSSRLIELWDVPFLHLTTLPEGDVSGDDTMNGDGGPDIMYGQGDNDTMHGNDGDDYMEGNSGRDTMYGDADEDDMAGGSGHDNGGPGGDVRELANVLDDNVGGTGDTMHGGDGVDFMAGDNASITRTSSRLIVLWDVPFLDANLPDDRASGDDTMNGNGDPDVMYGQGGNDTMHGNDGDDYMEGNSGSDTMYGDANEDDMAGGSGHDNGGDEAPEFFRELANVLDDNIGGPGTGDEMHGGSHVDYMVGDNGNLTRPGGTNSFNGSIKRDVKLYDVQVLDGDAIDERASGDDTMYGDGADDVMFGQGDNDDMSGGDGDDYMEGNHASDEMRGDAGQDDMTGGGSANDGVLTVGGNFIPDRIADDLLDGDDTMYGESDESEGAPDGDHADVMLGDNGVITRPLEPEVGGEWIPNLFNSTVKRRVRLADVETLGNFPLDESLSGDDRMWGNSNDDIMYGQGGEDEMHGGAGHDYMEGNAASDTMYGDGEDDDMLGGTGPTTSSSQLEELSDKDRLTAVAGRTDVSTAPKRTVLLGIGLPLPTEEVPLGDTMYGGEGADVMLGDNGIIIRPLEANQWTWLNYDRFVDHVGDVAPRHPTDRVDPEADPSGSRVDRTAELIDSAPGLVAGSDLMFGGPGDDDMYGQFDDTDQADPAIGDEMYGEEGEDAMAGDQGLFDNRAVTTDTEFIEPKEPFIDDHIFVKGSLFREFVLAQIEIGGDDRMRGGPGGDWMHGGAGDDVMNGDDGNDRLFGDDGDDDMWGGRHHDHLWGGNGFDLLDLHPRVEEAPGDDTNCDPLPDPDPAEWYEFAFEDGLATTTCDGNFEDVDYMYGGWDADAMQANIGDNGPRIGDRLIDWAGVYNLYILCPATYGEFVSTRDSSPHITEFLHRLAEGDGAFQPGPADKKGAPPHESGFNEIAFVYKKDIKYNSHPPYVDTPAHFNCTVDSITIP